MSSIFILFPREHRELVPAAMQHFVWAVERFEAMQQRNSLAKAALSVLKAIYIRLKKALGLLNPGGGGVHPGQCRLASACPMGLDGADAVLAAAGLTTTAATAPSTAATGSEDKPAALEDTDNNGSAASCVSGRVPPDSGLGSSVSGTSPSSVATTTTSWQQHQHQRQRQHQHQHQQRQANYDPEQPEDDAKTSSLHLETQGDEQQQSTTASGENDWGTLLPQDFDFASIMPTFPMGDLVYNDLAGVSLAGDGSALAAAQQQQSLSGLADGWLLDGGQQQPPHQATDQQQQQQQLWQFEGDFSDDSIWNLLNQYAPY